MAEKKYDNKMKDFLKTLGEGLLNALRNKPEIISPLADGLAAQKNLMSNLYEPRDRFDRVTYYTPRETPAYNIDGVEQMLTRTGTTPQPGYTAAVSPNLLKEQGGSLQMGNLVQLGGRTYRIEDVTNESIKNTLDIYRDKNYRGVGLKRNVPYEVVGRNTEGLKYNY